MSIVAESAIDLTALPAGELQVTAVATSNVTSSTSEFSPCVLARGVFPVNGKTGVTAPVSGVVKTKVPGGSFRVLKKGQAIPVGSLIDTTKGRVRLTTATGDGKGTQTAEFYAGMFKFLQAKGQTLVNLRLKGGNAKVCRPTRNKTRSFAVFAPTLRSSALAGARLKSKAVIRKLWGKGKGNYTTSGHHGSATVRGTHWLTADRCDGTFFRVKEGVVEVRDFAKKKTVILRPGGSYLARGKFRR